MSAISPIEENSFESTPANIADLLLRAADSHPRHGLHFSGSNQSGTADYLAYPALLTEARLIAAGLHEQACRPGSKIALLLEQPRDFIPAFWGCVLGGYVPCMLSPIRNDADRWATHLKHVDSLLDTPLFLTTGRLASDLPATLRKASLDSLHCGQAPLPDYQPQLADAAILMLTSGSTGNSKAVELTHANLLASMAGRARRQRLTATDTMFNWIAFDHVAALLESHMVAVYVGASQLQTEPATVLSDPLQFLYLIQRHHVTVAFAPNFLLAQLTALLSNLATEGVSRVAAREKSRLLLGVSKGPGPLSIRELDLSRLRRIVTGGEANVVATGRRLLELLKPYGVASNALWPAFGMTETCAASVYSDEFPDFDLDREFAAVGRPIDGLELRIVSEQGEPVPNGETGELQLRGPVIFGRYYNNEQATRDSFTADGWFRSGDVARLDDGRLRLVARSKDSIIVNGVNYYSHELERELGQLQGIDPSYIAAFPIRPQGAETERLIVGFATTFAADDHDKLYELAVAVRNTTIMLWGFRPTALLPLPRDAFPKTSLGKIQRSLMRKRFEAGEYASHSQRIADVTTQRQGPYVPPQDAVEITVADIFAKVLRLDPTTVSAQTSFFDLGGTSLDILALTQALKARLGFRVEITTILKHPTVRQLAEHIASAAKTGSRPYHPLVLLQETGADTPLFCVHPGNGEVLVLVNLAKYFCNDRPFYALRPPGFNEGEEVFKTFDELLGTYLAAILERQPHGPYLIAGYSLGCTIAFEIARELEARGERVAFLGCIDWKPHRTAGSISYTYIATGLASVLGLIDRARLEQLRRELQAAPPGEKTCKYILQFAAPERMKELDVDLDRFQVWARVAHAMEDLLFSHVTSGRVRAATVFRSYGFPPQMFGEQWHAQLNDWDDFCQQCRYVDVPGDHYTLMFPKHVATFQVAFRTEIERSLGESAL